MPRTLPQRPSPYASRLERIDVHAADVSVLGGVTRYWEYGDPNAKDTIILVHGFRGDHHGLDPFVAHLEGVRMISPDLPGFGLSTPLVDVGHDIDGYREWLTAFIHTLELTGRVIVLGHSFGSIIVAASIAAENSPQVSGIVLVNPIAQPALAGPRGVMTRLAVFYYRIAALLPESWGFALLRNRIIVRIMSITMAKTSDRSLRAWIHNQHDRYFSAFSDRSVVLDAFRASVSHNVSEYAPHITVPTLLVAAERDDITPIEAQRRLVTLFSNAHLVEIPDVGHLIHYEKPAEAALAINDFVSSGLAQPPTPSPTDHTAA